MLSDIRDFEPLEVYSDIITMIYRDEYYNPKLKIEELLKLLLANRNGPLER